jgi:hypothetical protein
MIMSWFLPVAVLIGIIGTHEAMRSRRASGQSQHFGCWLLLLVAWMPSVCWLIAQFIAQD